MEYVQIDPEQLSQGALRGLIREFVTRDGTDYGLVEHSLSQKMDAVKSQLRTGDAVIVFDMDRQSATILGREELKLRSKRLN